MKANKIIVLLLSACVVLSVGVVTGVLLSRDKQGDEPSPYLESYNFKRGMELSRDDEKQEEAKEFLEKEIEEHPKNGYAYFVLGQVLERENMPDEALENTTKAARLLKKDKGWISYVYRQMARLHMQKGDEEAALKDWKLSLKANPKDSPTYLDRAEYHYSKKNYTDAESDFDKVCTYTPDEIHGYMGKGRVAMKKKEYERAEKLFTHSIEMEPDNSTAYAFRAGAYQELNMLEECVDDIVKALEIDRNGKAMALMINLKGKAHDMLLTKLKVMHNKYPDDDAWPYFLGNRYQDNAKYATAIYYYKKCLKIEESKWEYQNMAWCYYQLGLYEPALENISRAIDYDAEDETLIMLKANLLYEIGRGREAIAVCDEYVKAKAKDYMGYYRRAFIKDNLNDTDGAIEDYTMAISLKPDDAYSYLGRGDKYLQKGNIKAAMKDYNKVVQLDTAYNDNNCAQYAYLGLGMKEKAKEFQKGILEILPSAANYYDAACLYGRMGEKEESLKYLRISLEKGFRRFAHIRNDDDLNIIRDTKEFRILMQEYQKKHESELREMMRDDTMEGNWTEVTSEIPFAKENGNCYVGCKINGLPMKFVFDTGASDVSLSMVEASFMMKNNYLSEKDVVGSAKYSDAQGNVSEGTVINLRKVEFGDVALDNVRASVVRNQKAPLLLGQSVLSRIGKIEIDNQKKVIRVRYMKEVEK